MSDGTPFETEPNDVETCGLPNVVMNCEIKETFHYPGFVKGQLWTPEHEWLHSLRTKTGRRRVFLSRALLEKRMLFRGGPSIFNSFFNPVNPISPPHIIEHDEIVSKVCSRRVPKSNQKS